MCFPAYEPALPLAWRSRLLVVPHTAQGDLFVVEAVVLRCDVDLAAVRGLLSL